MRIRTDDEVYRIDAVWLGPPRATFPWRARYVAWGVGITVFLLVTLIERRIGFGFSFFSTAWAVIITIVVTKMICSRINQERPLGAVAAMWVRELTAPRQSGSGKGGAASAARIRVRSERPRPKSKRAAKKAAKKSKKAAARNGSTRRSAAGTRSSSRTAGPQQAQQQPEQNSGGRRRPRRTRSKEAPGVSSPA
ncbi:hypothetical protein [Allokutzneria sp. NRRL B-24872]|uniref:hypothetical protein n=1 Tax=Allokutzneria sp. NRRL B-24872 TaxID=1137961 RepID=UPI000A3BB80B|nr:hypothetical protein [Allokutzneria sp. NRRL B-24872]